MEELLQVSDWTLAWSLHVAHMTTRFASSSEGVLEAVASYMLTHSGTYC